MDIPNEPLVAELSCDQIQYPGILVNDTSNDNLKEDPSGTSDINTSRLPGPFDVQQNLPLSRYDSLANHRTSEDSANAGSAVITNNTDSLLSCTEYELILQTLFVERTFPKGSGRYVGFEYMLDNVPHSKALALAMRSLQCVLVGQTHRDPRLSHRATIDYTHALSILRVDLLRGAIEPGHFIAIVHLFFKIELFGATSTQGSGWQQHIPGFHLASGYCQRNSVDPAVQILLRAVSYEFGLWDGLLKKRKGPCMMAQTPDRDCIDVRSEFVGAATQVPLVLEASDQTCRLGHDASSRVVMTTVARITASEGRLHQAIRECYSEIDGLPYWINSDDTFALSLGYERGDSYPKNTYSFPSLALARQHITYWMCLLSLHSAHLDILNSVTEGQYSFKSPKLRNRIRRNAGECADQLVMSLSYLLKQEAGYFGLSKAMAPLQLAFVWYRRCKDTTLMLYCQRIAERIQTFGLNCPWWEW